MAKTPCPVTLVDVLTASFRSMNNVDVEDFPGVEYDGYIARVHKSVIRDVNCPHSFTITIDHGPGSTVIAVHDENNHTWEWELATDPSLLIL